MLITYFDAACRAVRKDGLIVEITVLRAYNIRFAPLGGL